MKGFVGNIEQLTRENTNFRKVIYTAAKSQLVLMSIPVSGDIGEEVHDVDQFFRIEAGTGRAIIDGVAHDLMDDFAVVVPAGATHNVINTGDTPLKLYTIYSPAHHRFDVVHATKEDALDDDEHFDGTTNE
jgi:mannose-6-phosphate isomerase-like protein (cupin superfamily)